MKKCDVKSIITIGLVCTLVLITVGLVVAVIFGVLPSDNPLVDSIILLFSNATTMVMTYFFSKKKEPEGDKNAE